MLGPSGSSNMRRLSAILAVSSLVAMSTPASAAGDEVDERRMQAQTLYDQGLRLEGSDPKAALTALRSSYEIYANFRVLYNIARVCVKLGDKECATRSFDQYLKDGGTEVPAKRRKEIEGELKALSSSSRSTTSLTIKSSITGAFVKVDGSVVGRTPLAQPVPVRPGDHKVVLVADGNVMEKSVHVAAGASETVEIEAKKEEPAPAAVAPAPAPAATQAKPAATEAYPAATEAKPDEPPPPKVAEPEPRPARPSSSSSSSFPVVPWVVAGTFAAATGVSAYLTLSASSDYEALKAQYPVTREELDAAHGKGRDLLLVTGALGAVTVVSLGVASYFTFFRRSSAPQDRTVGVAIGPTGISVSGRLP